MLTGAISALLLLQSNSPAVTPLQNVIAGLNERNYAKIAAQYVGGKVISEEVAVMKRIQPEVKFSMKVISLKVSGNSGRIVVQVKESGKPQEETVQVVRSSGRWRIVASKKLVSSEKFFETLGVSVTQGGVFDRAERASRTTETLSNAKVVAVGINLYLSDNANKYSLTSATLRAAIQPYVKNIKVFFSRTTGKPFAFNDRLTGKNSADIAEPAKTVLLYEGSREKLTFTDGKTVVAFTDGQVRALSQAETKSGLLRWKP